MNRPIGSDGIIGGLLPEFVKVVEGPVQTGLGGLWPEEADCVANAVEKRRLEFMCGRNFARRAFRALGESLGPLLVGPDAVPCWPTRLTGSITHSAHYCAVAVARTEVVAAIGIDVEDVSRFDLQLTPYVLSPPEVAVNLQGFRSEAQQRRGATLFSAKEAIYKCLYMLTKTRLAFHGVAVELDGNSNKFTARLLATTGPFGNGHSFTGRYAFDGTIVGTAIFLSAGALSTRTPSRS